MTLTQIIDQVQGLVYGAAVAVGVAVLPILQDALLDLEANPDAFWTTAFWFGLGATAARSAGTAILTLLGVRIPGVSSGKEPTSDAPQ